MLQFFYCALRSFFDLFRPSILLRAAVPSLMLGMVVGVFGLVVFFSGQFDALEAWVSTNKFFRTWVAFISDPSFQALNNTNRYLARIVLVILAGPVWIIMAIAFVATTIFPLLLQTVVYARFPKITIAHKGSSIRVWFWLVSNAALALFLWVICLLSALVLPITLFAAPFLWGWLGQQVFTRLILLQVATPAEEDFLRQKLRWPLFMIGMCCCQFLLIPSMMLVAASSNVWAAMPLALVAASFHIFIFIAMALWFVHFILVHLLRLREQPF